MKLIRCDLDNFRVHKQLTVDFADGITGLIGDNESGKSSILESLEWALYGGKVVRGTAKGIRWTGAPARQVARAVWQLEIGGKLYTVSRSETKATVLLANAIIADGQDAVTATMTEAIGMTHAEFVSSHLARQKDIGRIAAMKPLERQTFVRNILGIGTLDDAVKLCRASKNRIAREVDAVSAVLGDGDEKRKNVKDDTLKLAECRRMLDVVETDYKERAEELKGREAALSAADERRDAHREASQALEYHVAALSKIKAKLEELRHDRQIERKHEAKIEELANVEATQRLPKLREDVARMKAGADGAL